MRKRFVNTPIRRCRKTPARERADPSRTKPVPLGQQSAVAPCCGTTAQSGPASDAFRTGDSRSINGQPPDRVAGQSPRQRDRPGPPQRPL